MLAKIDSACLQGLDGFRVQVEINIISGLPSFSIVGLPDASVREAKDRVVAAIRNTGFEFPAGRVTVNLSPADLRKEGSLYDVAMAVGILLAGEGIPLHRYPRCVWLGELALDGTIQPVRGVMPLLHSLHQKGWDQFVIPEGNLREASGVEGVQLFPFRTLKQLLEWVQDKAPVQAVPVLRTWVPERIQARVDLSEIKGQPSARRALEIAAAGNHNVLLVGPPGSGKSLLANALPGILPSWGYSEAMETTQLYSITGSLADGGVLTQRPFRNPHHTISPAALIGGGDTPLPGEISLAHRGVLFLDELSEFRHDTLEALRQPLEEGKVSIQRTRGRAIFPCVFLLVAAMNPCPCGYLGHASHPCHCSPLQIQKYRSKISGPLLDRFDLQVDVPALASGELLEDPTTIESSQVAAQRVQSARELQRERYRSFDRSIASNSELLPREIRHVCGLNKESKEFLKQVIDKLGLSARAFDRIRKVARTIADLEASDVISMSHVAEAVEYRFLDRRL